jgi:hypothetical protein
MSLLWWKLYVDVASCSFAETGVQMAKAATDSCADYLCSMIKSNECRIGNWVDDRWTNSRRRLTLEDFAREYKDQDFFNQIHPIYFTNEVLQKCGFEDRDGYYKLPDFSFRCYFEGGKLFVEFGEYRTSLKYLHQLQNLYFAHMDEELKVEL